MRSLSLPSSVLLVSLSLTAPAYAYIDPNSGGLVFQLVTPILALLAALSGFVRRYFALAWLALSAGVRNLLARLLRSSGREAE
jgi:hypothetical protein